MHRNLGASAIDLKRGLERGLAAAVDALRTLSRPVSGSADKVHVATISAHDDAAIGQLVAEAPERVGGEGIVTVEEAKGTETALEVVEGMQIDRGFLSPYFVTDPDKMRATLEDPLILLCDKRISAMKDLIALLEQVVRGGRSFMIVAEDVDGEAVATLVINELRGSLQCIAVKAPGFGARRKEMLQDLAILTGGQVISDELGLELAKVRVEDLGSAKKVVATKDDTTFIEGGGDTARIAARCRELRNRKDAFDDAIAATKAALAEGIVAGGGLTLLRLIDALEREQTKEAGDEATGVAILRLALEAPARQIAANSGADPGVVVDRLRSGKGGYGFDARTGRYVDLLEIGVIDPTKVVRTALENAVSVAGTLLLSQATLTEVEEPKPTAAAEPDFAA